MQVQENQKEIPAAELDIRDHISRNLLGVSSMLLMMRGEGRKVFESMGDLWQEGYIDLLVDLAEAARQLNARRRA